MAKRFCQVVEIDNGRFAIVAPSPFASVEGHCLVIIAGRYGADHYAKRVNALARIFKDPRAAAARKPE